MGIKAKHLILVFGLLSQAQLTQAHETEIVHPGVSNHSRELLATKGYDEGTKLYFDKVGNCNDIRDGSIAEDSLVGGPFACGVASFSWVEHFYAASGSSVGTHNILWPSRHVTAGRG